MQYIYRPTVWSYLPPVEPSASSILHVAFPGRWLAGIHVDGSLLVPPENQEDDGWLMYMYTVVFFQCHLKTNIKKRWLGHGGFSVPPKRERDTE